MSQRRATKMGLVVGTALCVSLFLYLRTPEEAERAPPPPAVADCGFYPDELCTALLAGKGAAPQVARFCQGPPGADVASHLRGPGNCSRLSRGLRFITVPLSAEEGNFSLAYIVRAPRELTVLVRLLRAVYAPQNLYCVHVDEDAPAKYRVALQTLAGCLENVFLSPRSGAAASPGPARLQAELDCMRELVGSRVGWSYALNLCAEDFPLRTNREIIRYLRSEWNDKNITPGALQPPPAENNGSQAEAAPGGSVYAPPNVGFWVEPPHNLTIYFGSANYVLTRKFVEFVLTDPRARDMLQWARHVHNPERHYWVTLNRLRDAPGATPDAGWEGNVRATKWKGQEGRGHSGCKGRYVQDRCVYGLGDLPWIVQAPSLFANKFEPSEDPLVVTCLERWHRRRVLGGAEVPLEPHWHFQAQTHFNGDLSG
ncbi:beta-1,3-galactosyl-O-glycosyl-glycoprotein beta-1,6-N-acetylglucosaminyltransferase 7-like [Sorex fumeus]|uniref:beta-1,3-galactosyl-O-glycosyl-glycoprotein beta-1,6-N-acetylglucosaminyltransferase 7-like n=1 Tax=Sorex fumeus TaxID=62283 RepID=UPI0024ADBD5E|nr:beta-1,3-galactosyl-O-glycosyl-glycoprotein beta-1,6-N-acetylglucosaminyltransferase 7-like [Sorex fumeus]